MKKIKTIMIFILCFVFLTSTISAIVSGLLTLTVKADMHNSTYLTAPYSDPHSLSFKTRE